MQTDSYLTWTESSKQMLVCMQTDSRQISNSTQEQFDWEDKSGLTEKLKGVAWFSTHQKKMIHMINDDGLTDSYSEIRR